MRKGNKKGKKKITSLQQTPPQASASKANDKLERGS